mgnify:CR=1 FL=1
MCLWIYRWLDRFRFNVDKNASNIDLTKITYEHTLLNENKVVKIKVNGIVLFDAFQATFNIN